MIFTPFASGFEEGTGLGMSLVFQYVQKMGWDITVASTPGRGTRIALAIPLGPGTFPPSADGQDPGLGNPRKALQNG